MDVPHIRDIERIDLEVTARCNLKCVMCPQAFDAFRALHDTEISLDDMERLRPLFARAKVVTVHGVGEAFLHSRLAEIFALLSEIGCVISFNTNALLWHKRNRELILRHAASIKWLHVSLDAATAETYARIRGGSFDKALRNVRDFIAERPGQHPVIFINMTVMRENMHEMPKLVELAATLDRCCSLWPLNNSGGSVYGGAGWVVKRKDGWTFKYDEQLVDLSKGEAHGYLVEAREAAARLGVTFDLDVDRYGEKRDIAACTLPFTNFEMLGNGEVRHCAYQTSPLFNWREAGLDDFSQHPRHLQVQNMIRQGRIPHECGHACCDFVQRAGSDEKDYSPLYAGRFRGVPGHDRIRASAPARPELRPEPTPGASGDDRSGATAAR